MPETKSKDSQLQAIYEKLKKLDEHDITLAVLEEKMTTLVQGVNRLNKNFEGNGIGDRVSRIETAHVNLAGSFRRCGEYEKARWKLLWKTLVAVAGSAGLLLLGWWLNGKIS